MYILKYHDSEEIYATVDDFDEAIDLSMDHNLEIYDENDEMVEFGPFSI